MCILCEMMKRDAAKRETVTPAQVNEAAIAPAPIDFGLESVLIELDHKRALVRSTDAGTILKLANAAKQLYTANLSTDGVTRLIGMLTAKPDEQVEAEQPEPAPATPAEEPAPTVPQELLDIAKAMGWDLKDIQVVRFPKL